MRVKRIAISVCIGAAIFAASLQARWRTTEPQARWKILESEHFRLRYTEGLEGVAAYALLYGEEARQRYVDQLEFEPKEAALIFLYAAPSEFSATNISPYPLDEGVGGFTDFYRRRIVLPFNGDYSALRHTLSHELVHAFQFQMLPGPGFGRYPLWLMEGMSEELALGLDASADQYARDALLSGTLLDFSDLDSGGARSSRDIYKGGQLAVHFLVQRFGRRGLLRFLRELGAGLRGDALYRRSFGVNRFELDRQFRGWLQTIYAGIEMQSLNPERLRRASDRFADERGFHWRPAISPDGRRIAVLTRDGIFPAIAERRTPGPDLPVDGRNEVQVVLRALRSSQYEEYQLLTTRISYFPDGKAVLLSAAADGRPALLAVDLEQGEVRRIWHPPFDSIQYPVLRSDGRCVAFVGLSNGQADLYTMDLEDSRLLRLTADLASERDPAYSSDGAWLYYASNLATGIDSRSSEIYAVAAAGGRPRAMTALGASSDGPMPAMDGALLFLSDVEGPRNVYRLKPGAAAAGSEQLEAITRAPAGVLQATLGTVRERGEHRELLAFTELEQQSVELRVVAGSQPNPQGAMRLAAVPLSGLSPPFEREWQLSKALPERLRFWELPEDDTGSLSFEGAPFVLVAGATDSDGKTRLAAVAAAALADDSGDHQLAALLGYAQRPVEWSGDLRYAYLHYRLDFFAGIYRQSGAFPIASIADLNVNNLVFNPYFRILNQDISGIFAGMEYPLHRFAAIQLSYEQGREERVFRGELPEERRQQDIYKNYQNITASFQYDNAVYSIYGPLDGQSLSLAYQTTFPGPGEWRDARLTIGEYRIYHLFDNWSLFALRLFGGTVRGRDAADLPFRIGGYNTIRGYDFQEFEGANAFYLNVEFRYTLIEQLVFAVPGRWSPGPIRAAFFFDAGSAFDDPQTYQAYSSRSGTTRDLYASYGVGLHWQNLLWFIAPGAVMKLEWATPYDLKRSLPPGKWRGAFSIGFNF
ncbi:MAG: BamA/TamA family outer membrane protein [Leptospirales bacterium]|nr:BamA/TamA family outer membrane protein [Leptospirales bacterium]